MTEAGPREGAFLGGRLVVWAPTAALRERRLVMQAGQPVHTLVRAAAHEFAADLHKHFPAAGLADVEVSAAGGGGRGVVQRLTGQVDFLFALSCAFELNFDEWKPELGSLQGRRTESTADPHPARGAFPAAGEPVLLGYLATLSGAHTAPILR